MEAIEFKAARQEWWQALEARPELETCLTKLNESTDSTDLIATFSLYSQAINLLWSGKKRLDKERNRTDTAAFRDLLLSMPTHRQDELFTAPEIQALADFTPAILNVKRLRSSEDYVPGEPIAQLLQEAATSEHREFTNALRGWRNQRSDDSRALALKKLADILFVVRSNIAHGEKTMRGPDLAKAERDRQVCEIALPVIRTVTDVLLDHPAQKLIAYGTLKPSEPNHKVLEPLTDQKWLDIEIEGTMIDKEGGLKGFRWCDTKVRHKAMLLKSSQLPSFWRRLDSFEGSGYRRTLATALAGELTVVAMIY